MRTSDAAGNFVNPFLDWTMLALKTGEMMVASVQVIGHRTARIAALGPSPSARDCSELALMGQEKFDAAGESMQAMVDQMLATNLYMWSRAFGLMLAGATDMKALASSRTLGESVARQFTLAQTMSQSVDTTAQLSASVAQLARRGMEPIRRRAVENGRRLAGG